MQGLRELALVGGTDYEARGGFDEPIIIDIERCTHVPYLGEMLEAAGVLVEITALCVENGGAETSFGENNGERRM